MSRELRVHHHPNHPSASEPVYGLYLGTGDVLLQTDVVAMPTGEWEQVPAEEVGKPIPVGGMYYVRPHVHQPRM